MSQTCTHSRTAGSRPSNSIFGARAPFGTPWEHQTTLMKQFTYNVQLRIAQSQHNQYTFISTVLQSSQSHLNIQ